MRRLAPLLLAVSMAAASLADKVLRDPGVISGAPMGTGQSKRRIARPVKPQEETSEPFSVVDSGEESVWA